MLIKIRLCRQVSVIFTVTVSSDAIDKILERSKRAVGSEQRQKDVRLAVEAAGAEALEAGEMPETARAAALNAAIIAGAKNKEKAVKIVDEWEKQQKGQVARKKRPDSHEVVEHKFMKSDAPLSKADLLKEKYIRLRLGKGMIQDPAAFVQSVKLANNSCVKRVILPEAANIAIGKAWKQKHEMLQQQSAKSDTVGVDWQERLQQKVGTGSPLRPMTQSGLVPVRIYLADDTFITIAIQETDSVQMVVDKVATKCNLRCSDAFALYGVPPRQQVRRLPQRTRPIARHFLPDEDFLPAFHEWEAERRAAMLNSATKKAKTDELNAAGSKDPKKKSSKSTVSMAPEKPNPYGLEFVKRLTFADEQHEAEASYRYFSFMHAVKQVTSGLFGVPPRKQKAETIETPCVSCKCSDTKLCLDFDDCMQLGAIQFVHQSKARVESFLRQMKAAEDRFLDAQRTLQPAAAAAGADVKAEIAGEVHGAAVLGAGGSEKQAAHRAAEAAQSAGGSEVAQRRISMRMMALGAGTVVVGKKRSTEEAVRAAVSAAEGMLPEEVAEIAGEVAGMSLLDRGNANDVAAAAAATCVRERGGSAAAQAAAAALTVEHGGGTLQQAQMAAKKAALVEEPSTAITAQVQAATDRAEVLFLRNAYKKSMAQALQEQQRDLVELRKHIDNASAYLSEFLAPFFPCTFLDEGRKFSSQCSNKMKKIAEKFYRKCEQLLPDPNRPRRSPPPTQGALERSYLNKCSEYVHYGAEYFWMKHKLERSNQAYVYIYTTMSHTSTT